MLRPITIKAITKPNYLCDVILNNRVEKILDLNLILMANRIEN